MSAYLRWIGVACLAATLGCGKSENAPVADSQDGSAQQAAAPAAQQHAPGSSGHGSGARVLPSHSPDVVVTQFLEALREGNKEVVASLLTAAARSETVRLGYEINPPGDPSSQYLVGRVEMPDRAGGDALVNSTWTHDLGGGEMHTYEVVWIVKQEEAGWRVSGLAVTDPQTEQPLVFNFENLQEVFDKKEQVETAQDANAPAARQAQAPAQDGGQFPAQGTIALPIQ